jgi:hypothetical protein
MNKLEHIFQNVGSCFNQLWTLKFRGTDTIEISTPYSTTSSKFVSLFLTERNGKYIISDGGLLNSEAYESEIDYENQCLLKILYHYENYYKVKRTQDKSGLKHYYKTTTNEKFIPNVVYEMAQFISMCASAATVKFEELTESEERKTFRKKATSYLNTNFQKFAPQFSASLDKEEFRTVRFSALIERNNRLNLINFVTGSTPANFRNSIAKANINFEIASGSKYENYIDNKIVLLNNEAEGFEMNKIKRQLLILQEHSGQEAVRWTERKRLLEIIN